MLNKYKSLFFDADGTLLDYEKAEYEALMTTFQLHHLSFQTEVHQRYQYHNQKLWQKFEKGQVNKDQVVLQRFNDLFAEFNIQFDVETIHRTYVEQLSKGTQLISGAYDLCRRLSKTHDLYIVTNGFEDIQRSRIQQSAIAPFISALYSSEAIGVAKPAPAFFDYVLEDIGKMNKKEVLVIGDSISADIQGAFNSELDVCWYNPMNAEYSLSRYPTYEIKELKELQI